MYLRHFDRISPIEMPDVSSIIIRDFPMSPAPSISFSQSVSFKFPVRSICASTCDSKEKNRFINCSFDISKLKMATALCWRNATFCAMLSANAVFPMEGLAAISIKSERCSPDSL